MKAVVFRRHGGPEQLVYEDVPEPAIAAHEVLVRVKACALNHLDIWIRQGIPAYPIALPHISGSDVAGVIERVGSSATGCAVGDRVFLSPGLGCRRCESCLAGQENRCASFKILGAQVDGGYAELVAVPAINVMAMPENLSFEEAAAFPLVSVTAWHMVFGLADLRPGETVLVLGAGSGVGSMAVQMASLAGARVFTTVGSEGKIAKAAALGAERVFNHAASDFAEHVKAATGGRGVDVVIEHIGTSVWDACLATLARGGRLVTCGVTTGGQVSLDVRVLFARQLTIKGSYMGTRQELNQAVALLGRGRLKPVVDRVFPLREARAAQELMLSRKFFGKIVLATEDVTC